MVVLHLKSGGGSEAAADGTGGGGGDGDAFLYETSCATPVDVLITDLVGFPFGFPCVRVM